MIKNIFSFYLINQSVREKHEIHRRDLLNFTLIFIIASAIWSMKINLIAVVRENIITFINDKS